MESTWEWETEWGYEVYNILLFFERLLRNRI